MKFTNDLKIQVTVAAPIENRPEGFAPVLFRKRSQFSVSQARILRKMCKACPPLFAKSVESGQIDINHLFLSRDQNEGQCILNSVYFGIIFYKFNQNILSTTSYILNKYSNLEQFTKGFLQKYPHFDIQEYRKKNIVQSVQYIAKVVKHRILVFGSEQIDKQYLLFKTSQKIQNRTPLTLLFLENHAFFIYDFKNLTAKGKTFCRFCLKSVCSLVSHICAKRRKCLSCLRFLTSIEGMDNSNLCLKQSVHDTFFVCPNCNKQILNHECKKKHLALSKTNCLQSKYCSTCDKYYRNNFEHSCDTPICKICHKQHKKGSFCLTYDKKPPISTENNKYFVFHIEEHSCKIIACFAELSQNSVIPIIEFKDDNIFRYQFNLTDKSLDTTFYSEKFQLKTLNQMFLQICSTGAKFICDVFTFDYVFDKLKCTDIKIFTKKNRIHRIQVNGYDITSIDSFIDTSAIKLLQLSGLDFMNPLFLIKPFKCLTEGSFNECSVSMQDYLQCFFSADLTLLKYLNKFANTIKHINRMDISQYLGLTTFNMCLIFAYSCIKYSNLFTAISKQLGNKDNCINIFDYNSGNSAFYYQIIKAIEKLPIIHYLQRGDIYNTSKAEIILCQALLKTHECSSKDIKCFVINDGSQKCFGKYSLDFWCNSCNSGILVHGLFKYHCSKHSSNISLSRDLAKRHQQGIVKRRKLTEIAGSKIQTFVMCTECVLKSEFPREFLLSCFYSKELPHFIKLFKQNYDRDQFIKLNPQSCIQQGLVLHFEKEFTAENSKFANKLDITSAFVSAFQDTNLWLPTSNTYEYKVQESANEYFNRIKKGDYSFGMCKITVLINQFIDLPFLPLKIGESSEYRYCKMCSKRFCKHSDSERSFIVSCYLIDALFMRDILDYKIYCHELYRFPSCHSLKMQNVSNVFMDFRNTKCKITNKIAKTAILGGLGRSAYRLDVALEQTLSVFSQPADFRLSLLNNKLHTFGAKDNFAFCVFKQKPSNYDIKQNGYKLCLTNFMYGLAASLVRQQMFKFVLIKNYDPRIELRIVRFDVDSIIFRFINDDSFGWYHLKKFLDNSCFKFKCESKCISKVISFSKQSHLIEEKVGTSYVRTLKTAGLSMNLFSRNEIYNCKV